MICWAIPVVTVIPVSFQLLVLANLHRCGVDRRHRLRRPNGRGDIEQLLARGVVQPDDDGRHRGVAAPVRG